MLSRNFRLQQVGNINWVENQYNFKDIAFSIDELIILDVSRNKRDCDKFCETVRKLIRNIFVPIALGGGITNAETARKYFRSGADKIILNTALTGDSLLVNRLIKEYGSQAIVASVDFTLKDGELIILKENGKNIINMTFHNYTQYLNELGVGEIYLNSIDRDGTGQGYMFDRVEQYFDVFKSPVIISGGAGNATHFIEAARHTKINAVATANLFNFIGKALPEARETMVEAGINMSYFQPMSSMEVIRDK